MAARTIAYLTPLYYDERSCLGGGERYPLNMARGVVKASRGDVRVLMLSFGEAEHEAEMAPGVTLKVLRAAGRPRNPLDVVSWDLPAAIAPADLVHIHQAYTRCSEMGLLVARQQKKPVVVTDHGGQTSPLGVELNILDLADRVVAYSDFGASLYRTRTPIEVIKGGVDASRFLPPEHNQERDRVLFVGRLLPHKGVDRLIEALPPDLPLSLCGRAHHADYHDRLRRLAEGKRVEFITDADDHRLGDLYRRAWATVLPSVYRDCYGNVYREPELMGLTALESMSCGTPAIVNRVAAMPEFVAHGETGFICDTPDELTGYLRQLAADPDLATAMGRQGRKAVEAEFDLAVAGKKLLDVYERLLVGNREEERAA